MRFLTQNFNPHRSRICPPQPRHSGARVNARPQSPNEVRSPRDRALRRNAYIPHQNAKP